jgi:hypothetical protein
MLAAGDGRLTAPAGPLLGGESPWPAYSVDGRSASPFPAAWDGHQGPTPSGNARKEEPMKNVTVQRVDVWAAGIKDEPGGLAAILSGLREAGADLDFVVARRSPEKPGTGVVFVTPLRGDREVSAAATLGFNVTGSLKHVRIEGENRPGIGAEITETLAAAGINLHGLSAAVIGSKFIIYVGLDSSEDAAKAEALLRKP